MKVLMLTTTFPESENNLIGPTYELAKKLVEKGVYVKALTPHIFNSKEQEYIKGIDVTRFKYMYPPRFQNLTGGEGILPNIKKSLFSQIQIPFLFFSFFTKCLRISTNYALIHAHWILAGLVAVLIKKIRKHFVILTTHGSDINKIPAKGPIRRISIFSLKSVDLLISVSKDLKSRIIKLGIPAEKILVIPNGVDIDKFDINLEKSNKNRLLFVGRLIPVKGLRYLIEAMKYIKEALPQVFLTIIGEGYLKESLTQLTKVYSLDENIIFEGKKSHTIINKNLKESSLFVLPSLSEGLSVAVLEAMACGVPVVASKVGGMPDVIIENQTGILVPPRNSEILANTIITLLKDNRKITSMGIKARERIEANFSWDIVANRIIEIYKSIID